MHHNAVTGPILYAALHNHPVIFLARSAYNLEVTWTDFPSGFVIFG